MTFFVNFTNHKLENWSREQFQAAKELGYPVELPFPDVPADADEEYLDHLAQKSVNTLMRRDPKYVLVQGEMTLVYRIVSLLKAKGVICLAACSEREAAETKLPDGNAQKTSVFRFVRFRRY